MNEHTHIIKIYFIGALDSYYIMGYSPEKYANNYERGITHDGH